MRQIILDTETSGLDFEKDRIIEVGCIELINGVFTGRKFHKYYKPENIIISQESEQIHGLNSSLLSSFPTFDDSVEELLDFIHQSQLIIHNVQFDLTMINQSLKRKSLKELDRNNTLCTLELAKKKFPGSKNNLNALCRRFDINLDSREKHGALIDSFLLLDVYNELLGGKQKNLDLTISFLKEEKKIQRTDHTDLPHVTVTSEETKEHHKMLEKMKNNNWW